MSGVLLHGAELVRGGRRMVMASRAEVVVGVLERVGKEALAAALRTGGVARSARVYLSPEEGAVWGEVSAELLRRGYSGEVVVTYAGSGVPSMVRVSWGGAGKAGRDLTTGDTGGTGGREEVDRGSWFVAREDGEGKVERLEGGKGAEESGMWPRPGFGMPLEMARARERGGNGLTAGMEEFVAAVGLSMVVVLGLFLGAGWLFWVLAGSGWLP